MFDILAVVDLTGNRELIPMPNRCFLYDYLGLDVHLKCKTLRGPTFWAEGLSHNWEQDKSYHTEKGLHIFIVGEAFANAEAQRTGRFQKGLATSQALLLGYQELGPGILQLLKGNFTLIVIEGGSCLLASSRFGTTPFFYAAHAGTVFLSTSLAAILNLSVVDESVDRAGLAEIALFECPLYDRTMFQNIKRLPPATLVDFEKTSYQQRSYWDFRSLYTSSTIDRQEALETGSELFYQTVSDMASDWPKMNLSFTGGFDSRAILSALKRDPDTFRGYSFGIPGSLNLSIPLQLCREMGFQYEPIYLAKEYESVFNKYALQAVMLSEGLSTVERANYPYAFHRLSAYAPCVMTGLFGSELLRTFQNIGWQVTDAFVRLNNSINPSTELKHIFEESKNTTVWAPEIFEGCADDLLRDLNPLLSQNLGLSPDERFYSYLFMEGLRSYFGAELHMERIYATNRFPFLDDDFVTFIFKAPFAGVHSRSLKPTIGNRFNSQYFYAYVIRQYNPKLLSYPTDHGYPPSYLLESFPILRVGMRLVLWRMKRMLTSYDEFRTEHWTRTFYRQHLRFNDRWNWIFSDRFNGRFEDGSWVKDRLKFARAASLRIWINTLVDAGALH